jgi:hypothetical protein
VDILLAGILSFHDSTGERHFSTHSGKFDEHGQVHTGKNLNFPVIEDGEGKVGGCATKHICENNNPFATINIFDGLQDIHASCFHVVIGPDADGLNLRLFAANMFHGRNEFVRQMSVCHEDETNHTVSAFSAPHSAAYLYICQLCCAAQEFIAPP